MKDLLLKGVFVVAGLFLSLTSHAINVDSLARVEAKEFGRLPKQAASLQVGLNTSEETSVAYELDYQWYPLNYVGIGIGLELDDDYGNRPLIEARDDDDYDPDRIVKFNIHPMLSFRTPTLWMNKRHSWGGCCAATLVWCCPSHAMTRCITQKLSSWMVMISSMTVLH